MAAATLVRLVCLAAAATAAVWTGAAAATAWWLTNQEPPAIEADAPGGPLRGTLTVPLALRVGADAAFTSVTLDGAEPPPGALRIEPELAAGPSSWWADWWHAVHTTQRGPGQAAEPTGASGQAGEPARVAATITLDTTRLADGTHTLRVAAVDRSRNQNRAEAALSLTTDNTPPNLALWPVEPRLAAGRPLAIRATADEAATLRATWGGEALPLFPAGPGAPGTNGTTGTAAAHSAGGETTALAFVAVPVDSTVGERAVEVDGRDRAGNEARAQDTLKIDAVRVPSQALVVPPALQPLATGPVATAETAQLVALTSAARPERLWHEPFRQPIAGVARTTGFGDRREYADGYVVYHSGYDLAVPAATPVPASADGVVVFAGALPQRGNCVVVDHGWGVYTLYAHLSQLGVEAGQTVAQGQPLGLVGTTGLSTGPHLHWEVRLRGIPVDPGSWVALTAELGNQ